MQHQNSIDPVSNQQNISDTLTPIVSKVDENVSPKLAVFPVDGFSSMPKEIMEMFLKQCTCIKDLYNLSRVSRGLDDLVRSYLASLSPSECKNLSTSTVSTFEQELKRFLQDNQDIQDDGTKPDSTWLSEMIIREYVSIKYLWPEKDYAYLFFEEIVKVSAAVAFREPSDDLIAPIINHFFSGIHKLDCSRKSVMLFSDAIARAALFFKAENAMEKYFRSIIWSMTRSISESDDGDALAPLFVGWCNEKLTMGDNPILGHSMRIIHRAIDNCEVIINNSISMLRRASVVDISTAEAKEKWDAIVERFSDKALAAELLAKLVIDSGNMDLLKYLWNEYQFVGLDKDQASQRIKIVADLYGTEEQKHILTAGN